MPVFIEQNGRPDHFLDKTFMIDERQTVMTSKHT